MRVRSEILRTYQVVHSWTGILSGLLLFIGFFAGALILFQSNITQWATPATDKVSQAANTDRDALLQQVLAAYPQTHKQVDIHFEAEQPGATWTTPPGRDIHLSGQTYQANLKQQELTVHVADINLLTTLVDQLHRTGGLIGEVGHEHWGTYILGIASVLYFLALMSGVIFLLPTLVKNLFALRTHKKASRFWLDSHNLLGIFSLPFHVVIALTVVVFVFHDFFYAGLNPIYGDKPMFARPTPSAQAYNPVQLPPLQTLVDKAEQEAEGYRVENIRLMNLSSKSPMAMIAVTHDKDVVRGPYYDYVYMHPYTLQSFDFGNAHSENGTWAKIVRAFFAVHFGSFGGDSGRWLYFVLGLTGAALFYTGNLLWLDKKYQNKAAVQPKSVSVLARLTVGVPLGSMLGVAAAFALTKPLGLSSLPVNQSYMLIYYLCFVCSVGLCFKLDHIRGALTLCNALVATLCAIPAISLILHFSGVWPVSTPTQWLVDAMALLFALVFWSMGRRTAQRAHHGADGSLWKLPPPTPEGQLASPQNRG